MSVSCELNLLKQPINNRVIRLDSTRVIYFRGNNVISLNTTTGESEVRELLSNTTRIKAIACHPNFGAPGSSLIAVGIDSGKVYLYDFESDHLSLAHNEHKTKQDSQWMGLHMTGDASVVSVVGNTIIKFCSISRKTTVSHDLPPKFSATELAGAPTAPDLLAIGSYCGLVVIVSLKDLKVKHLFRGHNIRISSIVWMPKGIASNNPLVDDEDDCFDVYNDDHFRDDFGVEKKRVDGGPPGESSDTVESPPKNSNFDFVEACETLKQDILLQRTSETVSTPQRPVQPGRDECQFNRLDDSNVSLPSNESNASSNLENMFEKIDINEAEELTLVTLDQDMGVWVWDVNLNCAKTNFRISLRAKQNNHRNGNKQTIHTAQMFLLDDNQTVVGNSFNGFMFTLNMFYDVQKNKVEYDYQVKENNSVVLAAVDKKQFLTFHPPYTMRLMEYRDPKNSKMVREFQVYNTMGRTIAVCDLNPMRVAIGTHEICLFDLTAESSNSCSFTTYYKNLKSAIVCLAWHPELEILAFGTMEGRIGIYNPQKNTVDFLKPFTGKEIYDLAFGKIGNEFQLFACCSSGKCVTYYKNFTEFIFIFGSITSISALYMDNDLCTLFIGTKQGEVFHCEMRTVEESLTNGVGLHPIKVSKNYIRMFRVNCNHSKVVVVSKNPEICVIPTDKLTESTSMESHFIRLKGHSQPIVFVDVSRSDPDLIISASYDSTLRVWHLPKNATAEQSIVAPVACYEFSVNLKYAIFSPLNEDCIIVGTYSTPFYVFNTHSKKSDFPPKIVNVSAKEPSSSSGAVRDDKGAPIVQNGVHSTSSRNNGPKVESSKAASAAASENTIFYLAKRESKKRAIQCLQSMVCDKFSDVNFLNKKMFSHDIKDIIEILQDEEKNYNASHIKTNGTELIALMSGNVKEAIVQHMKDKTITEEMVGIAPMVSHAFWKLCAEAFALQLIEEGLPLKAVVYLLGIHKVDDALQLLLEKNFYREALILLKMKKAAPGDDAGNALLGVVAQKWIEYLDLCGDYEHAAVVATGIGAHRQALEELMKRREEQLTDDHREVIESLKVKLEVKQ